MDKTKAWYTSKTVWGAIITLASMAASAAGYSVSDADQQALVEHITGATAALGAVIALFGRLLARDRIG